MSLESDLITFHGKIYGHLWNVVQFITETCKVAIHGEFRSFNANIAIVT